MDNCTEKTIVAAIAILFVCHRLFQYLRFFQQEEYKPKRFLVWYFNKLAFDKKGTLVAFLAGWIALSFSSLWGAILGIFGVLLIIWQEGDPRVKGKVKLNMTERATRIFGVALIIELLAILFASLSCNSGCSLTVWFKQILIFQLVPFSLILSNWLLTPFENRIQSRFLNEAKAKYRKISPFTIAITGSYGKTSTKTILGELMNVLVGPTFFPPKSYNTPMGVVREIRERLGYGFRYAVIEMGAYGIGSIKRLCGITPPNAAIVTAVGIMHLERFGSEENIYKAKSELAQAVPADGILVCNGDNPGARRMAREYSRKTTILYGMDPSLGHLDCLLSDIKFSPSGTSFLITWRGQKFPGATKLLGRPALSNILGSFCMLCELGVNPEAVVAAIKNIGQIENRLSLDQQGGVTYLRDAYNSNPTGFKAALDVMKDFQSDNKIVMTPGMIELGDQQDSKNEELARYALEVADFLIVVGPTNKAAFERAARGTAGAASKVVFVDNREEGFVQLGRRASRGAVVLIENDLSDLYEQKVNF